MTRVPSSSYSFSFQISTVNDVKYFKKTDNPKTLNVKVQTFVLEFVTKPPSIDTMTPIKKGRPELGRVVAVVDRYKSIQFSLPNTTIKKVKAFKKKKDVPSLDHHLEEYIKTLIPTRD